MHILVFAIKYLQVWFQRQSLGVNVDLLLTGSVSLDRFISRESYATVLFFIINQPWKMSDFPWLNPEISKSSI